MGQEERILKTRTRRILILGGGWTLVVLGVAGLFLPFLQGILFLLAGLWLLSLESAWAARQRDRLHDHPRTGPHMRKAEAWARGLHRRASDREGGRRREADRRRED